jgi:hypothetical protein
MYTCPVCAFDALSHPPEAYMICTCCGTEFENDDEEWTHADLRVRWIANGMNWWSRNTSPPENWDPRRGAAGQTSELKGRSAGSVGGSATASR